jgi:RHS repeat-associated protein
MQSSGEIEPESGRVPRDLPTIWLPGHDYDAETGLHYNRLRYYDPVVGRCVSAEPIGQRLNANACTDARLNPTVSSDPGGELRQATAGSFSADVGCDRRRGCRRALDG